MAVGVGGQQAALGLLKRAFFSEEESKLTNFVFGTNEPPFPAEFLDPQSELVRAIEQIVLEIMMNTTVSFMFRELRLSVDQVNQLDVSDARITGLKQKIFGAAAQIPEFKELRNQREKIIRCLNINVGR